MNTPVATEMLRLFQSGAATYQPEGLAFESGDPKVAAANLRQLLGSGRMIIDVLCRPTGTLFLLSTGEQYYARSPGWPRRSSHGASGRGRQRGRLWQTNGTARLLHRHAGQL